jgi:hypothetical protein
VRGLPEIEPRSRELAQMKIAAFFIDPHAARAPLVRYQRGVFISHSGFTEDGLHAFGRGKRIICVDGLDLYEIVDRRLPLDEVLDCKVRRAAETGRAFIRVRELF